MNASIRRHRTIKYSNQTASLHFRASLQMTSITKILPELALITAKMNFLNKLEINYFQNIYIFVS